MLKVSISDPRASRFIDSPKAGSSRLHAKEDISWRMRKQVLGAYYSAFSAILKFSLHVFD
jgi:hypothetical protein